jgi:SAM-dependent methyltransferase
MVEQDDALEEAKERAFREVGAINAAHARGEIDDAGWHSAIAAIVVPAYLSARTVEGGSGFSGSAPEWEWSRGLIAEALHRDGTFLDIGCANGLLMESVASWGRARGLSIEPYGLEIASEIAASAQARLPGWAGRVHVGNALGWRPPFRFDFVRTGLEYAPPSRRRDLVDWLLRYVVAPGGRLVVGKYNEEMDRRAVEDQLVVWGSAIAGRAERACRHEPRIAYRAVWIDTAG